MSWQQYFIQCLHDLCHDAEHTRCHVVNLPMLFVVFSNASFHPRVEPCQFVPHCVTIIHWIILIKPDHLLGLHGNYKDGFVSCWDACFSISHVKSFGLPWGSYHDFQLSGKGRGSHLVMLLCKEVTMAQQHVSEDSQVCVTRPPSTRASQGQAKSITMKPANKDPIRCFGGDRRQSREGITPDSKTKGILQGRSWRRGFHEAAW